MPPTTNSMNAKICLVTGANSGIGKATALGLAKLGATVVMVCRDQAGGQSAQAEIIAATGNQAVDLMLADLSSLASIRQLSSDFKAKHSHLHVLINNAAVNLSQRTVTADSIETIFAVNHLAPFLLTHLLLDVLKASAPARIVNVASRGHSRQRPFQFFGYFTTALPRIYPLGNRHALFQCGCSTFVAHRIHPACPFV